MRVSRGAKLWEGPGHAPPRKFGLPETAFRAFS